MIGNKVDTTYWRPFWRIWWQWQRKTRKKAKSDKDKKAKEKAAKQFEQLKEQAQKELNVILEKNMSEDQLDSKHYNDDVNKLQSHLDKKLISKQQYQAGVLALRWRV